ncbi:hypothetical protein ACFQ9R_28795 [Nocardia sp. NPDC056541]|uniref:hypothetical protein n=1 Tax=Nocardia sp. NPDC056541 TaxID=3345860 RepID=UPI00366E68CC
MGMADEVRRQQQQWDAETLSKESERRKRVAAYTEVLNRNIREFARAAKELGIEQEGRKDTLFNSYVRFWRVNLSFSPGGRYDPGFGYANIGVRADGSWIFLRTSLGGYEEHPAPIVSGRTPTNDEIRAALQGWLSRNAPRG